MVDGGETEGRLKVFRFCKMMGNICRLACLSSNELLELGKCISLIDLSLSISFTGMN